MAINLRKGNIVIHPKLPEWGEGEVLELFPDKKVKINFENVGIKILQLDSVQFEVLALEKRNFLKLLAPPEGFEPPTCGFEVRRSIRAEL
jgi:transcription elongation factor GreA-like protein